MQRTEGLKGFEMGDVVYVDFSPTAGHEQNGNRPAMVVSEATLFKETGMVWVVPITRSDSKFPTHFPIATKDGKIEGTVLPEHIKSIDPIARKCKKVDEATDEKIREWKKIHDAITFIAK